MIRLGATIDKEDALGSTPLLVALEAWRVAATGGGAVRASAALLESITARQRFVVTCLVEQHANVNIAKDGYTPLHKACMIGDWDLIALLLSHGANPSPPSFGTTKVAPPTSFLRTAAHKTRFRSLLKQFPAGHPRPPRKCPCWSNKSLDSCHNVGTDVQFPYPDHFACICGSRKPCRSCSCRRRKLNIVERWNNNEGYIQAIFLKPVELTTSAGISKGEMDKMMDIMASATEARRILGIERPLIDVGEIFTRNLKTSREHANQMVKEGSVDPAYAFALHQVDFSPRPQGRTTSKRFCAEMQEEWNKAVDKYIQSGVDPRPKSEIERNAKLGLSCGALYRHCEGVGCTKMEGKDIQALQKCSKCKMAVYCGRTCQSSAWKEHKTVCNTQGQREQELPSQRNLIERAIGPSLSKIQKLMSDGRLEMPEGLRQAMEMVKSGQPLEPEVQAFFHSIREGFKGAQS